MKKLNLLLFTILISLCVNAQTVTEISRSWTSFVQSIDIQSDTLRKFKVIASVKVETSDDKARAGVWARVDNKPNQGRGFFDNMGNRPIRTNKWQSYTIEGIIDSKSEKINFGGILYNNGKFFFDKFEIYIENDNGEYEFVNIDNSSFEDVVVDNTIPKWDEGVTKERIVKVKEFSFISNKDSVDGSYSLLIEGNGIKPTSQEIGDVREIFPYLGIIISLLFILIFIISSITNILSTADATWSKFRRIGFRFSFIYFSFIILFQNNGAYPFFGFIIQKPSEWLQKFGIWFGDHILKIPYIISTGPNGSGDTTYDYIVVSIGFLVAVLGAIIWSVLDRKRTHYTKMYYWLTTGIRYYVGLMLISYGMVKVIQLQFPSPTFYRLLEPYGESSPMGLAWTFLGFSEGYNMFMGIAEVLAGLLLFRRTMTFGAVITLMTTMNVMAVNYFFDVPVKILSTHLVIMTLFLLSRDIKKVMLFLVTDKPVEKLTLIKRPQLKKGVNIGLNVFKGAILIYALGFGFFEQLGNKKIYGTDAPKPELYGVYEVTNYVINGDTIVDYKDNRLWKNIVFERVGSVQINKMNKQRSFYRTEMDSTTQKVKFFASRRNPEDYFDFNYTKTENTLNFNYIYKNDTISGQTKRLDKDDFLLTNRGFNWISERPFNR
ncbi:hypothetical protein D7030_13810 [Flavobacteriaceae bacterium AU392]|nr:hypothetical protein D1817_04680 [Flavobacteriaceae bacterium]RKM81378.1 hypothetical protein D7030_13810 [Flavobacteriaceae bacterium AU392]